ncbi:MAG: 2-hydroxyacid dehydrogenase [Flavobacteriales bacterium]|nr:2-hydroxyacid dehydrogenase [Flavobacteriales bacterium]
MKVLVYSTHGFDRAYLEKAAGPDHHVLFTEEALRLSTAHLAEGMDAVALFTSDQADAPVLEKLRTGGVRYVTLRSVGYDHVDLEKARQLGMKVAHVPEYSPWSVAEHAVTLLMALNRKLLKAHQLFMQNDFRLDELIGFDVHGKVVGIVGTGRIGSAFARIMHGFGCQLLGHDIQPREALTQSLGLRYCSLEELCRASDVVACFCPLTPATRHLFREEVFRLMKPGVFFINTARGAIVHTRDLLKALDEGIVGAAGLDVYENEKDIYFRDCRQQPPADPLFEALRAHPRVVLTAHQAFLTREALEAIAATTFRNVSEWEKQGFSHNDLV